jgi:endonuclease YncB( thermonuclease family)
MALGNITVTVGNATNPRTTAITYGSRTLKSATDLNLQNVGDGFAIVYQANTNSFVTANTIAEAQNAILNSLGNIDGGTF